MIKSFFIYFKSLNLPKSAIEKVEEKYNFYLNIAKINIEDIFISNYVNKDGTTVYDSLWFFSKEFAVESKSFITQDNYDCTFIKNNIIYWECLPKNMKEKPDDKSRLKIGFNVLNLKEIGEFQASGINCGFLIRIFQKYIAANVKLK